MFHLILPAFIFAVGFVAPMSVNDHYFQLKANEELDIVVIPDNDKSNLDCYLLADQNDRKLNYIVEDDESDNRGCIIHYVADVSYKYKLQVVNSNQSLTAYSIRYQIKHK